MAHGSIDRVLASLHPGIVAVAEMGDAHLDELWATSFTYTLGVGETSKTLDVEVPENELWDVLVAEVAVVGGTATHVIAVIPHRFRDVTPSDASIGGNSTQVKSAAAVADGTFTIWEPQRATRLNGHDKIRLQVSEAVATNVVHVRLLVRSRKLTA